MPSNTEIFSKYPNNIFIETGSYLGDGILSYEDGYQEDDILVASV